jgi:hypothetical protein
VYQEWTFTEMHREEIYAGRSLPLKGIQPANPDATLQIKRVPDEITASTRWLCQLSLEFG